MVILLCDSSCKLASSLSVESSNAHRSSVGMLSLVYTTRSLANNAVTGLQLGIGILFTEVPLVNGIAEGFRVSSTGALC